MTPLPAAGYVFRASWPLGTSDLDDNACLRVDGIGRNIQECGMRALEAADMYESHPHWIVRRTVIDVIEPIAFPSELHLSRWCDSIATRWCNVRCRIEGDGGGLIETEAFWICMNADTMMPKAMSDEFLSMIGSSAGDTKLRWKPWLSKDLAADKVAQFPLRRSDIDWFKHLTNAAYWHAIYEVAADHPELTDGPHRYVIEYNKPIPEGSQVELHTSLIDGALQIAFVVDGDARTRAAISKLSAD